MEKHFFVEDDIIARNDLEKMKMKEPKTYKKKELLEAIDLMLKEPEKYFPRDLIILRALQYLIKKSK